jgi:hypothetical protein
MAMVSIVSVKTIGKLALAAATRRASIMPADVGIPPQIVRLVDDNGARFW